MTNGEKIKATFPHYDIEIDEHKGYVRVFYEDFYTTYPLRWWNAEYKEPTAKNDLGVKHHKQNIQAYAHDFGVSEEQAETELRVTKNDLGADCIDRNSIKYYPGTGGYMYASRGEIDQLPPVTPQPRKGRWIYTPQQRLVDETDDGCVYETDYKCSCSECGGDFGFIKNKDAFCKFCGADMRGKYDKRMHRGF